VDSRQSIVLAGKKSAHGHATNNPEPLRRFRFGGRSADDGTEVNHERSHFFGMDGSDDGAAAGMARLGSYPGRMSVEKK
jgi:hypothetical protein